MPLRQKKKRDTTAIPRNPPAARKRAPLASAARTIRAKYTYGNELRPLPRDICQEHARAVCCRPSTACALEVSFAALTTITRSKQLEPQNESVLSLPESVGAKLAPVIVQIGPNRSRATRQSGASVSFDHARTETKKPARPAITHARTTRTPAYGR